MILNCNAYCLFILFASIIKTTVQFPSDLEKNWDKNSIVHLHGSRGHYVRCNICMKYPEIVKLHAPRGKVPSIATETGVRNRATVVENHLTQTYHLESVKAERIKLLEIPQSAIPLDSAINKANKQQADHIGKLLIQIFTDAKRLTLTAWNWPARYVASVASNAFSIENENATIIPSNVNRQYVNPKSHLALMSCIVESDVNSLKTKIDSCLALSLRVDGSIDRTHIDKIYVLAKIVTSVGNTELIFMGMKEQVERYAIGLLNTALGAMEDRFGHDFLYDVILKKVSSICTDGPNVNSGESGGMWAFLEQKMSENESEIPLIKIWCVAHRSDLVFEDLTNTFSKVDEILSTLSRISSYFHVSPIRLNELQKIASDINLKLLSMPKIFHIRWTQFTFQLVRAISNNWRALTLYFEKNTDAQSRGYYSFLTKIENLTNIAFLGDVLFIFQRFQKKLQSDSLTLLQMSVDVENMMASLENLKNQPIPSGFVSKLESKISIRNEKPFFHNIELNAITHISRACNESILESFRETVINRLVKYLQERFQFQNKELLSVLEDFFKFDDPTVVERIHKLVGEDLDLAALYIQFTDFCANKKVTQLPLHKIVQHLATPERYIHFKELTTVLARILACTPHSADVERCISANNLLKTNMRSNLSIETENMYLYIYFNLPNLENWNPKNVITKWMSQSRRNRTIDTDTSTTRKQPHFKGIFENCDDEDIDNGDESDCDAQIKFDVF